MLNDALDGLFGGAPDDSENAAIEDRDVFFLDGILYVTFPTL